MKQTQNLKINKHTQTKEHQGFTWFSFWPTSKSNNEEISLIKIWRYSHTPNPQYNQQLSHKYKEQRRPCIPIHPIALSQIQGIEKKEQRRPCIPIHPRALLQIQGIEKNLHPMLNQRTLTFYAKLENSNNNMHKQISLFHSLFSSL